MNLWGGISSWSNLGKGRHLNSGHQMLKVDTVSFGGSGCPPASDMRGVWSPARRWRRIKLASPLRDVTLLSRGTSR